MNTSSENESITGFHAHVYYDAATKPAAATLRDAIEERFTIEMGRWHDQPIGPHPTGSYQVAFEPPLFGELVPWLAMNRGELIVFIHPLTGDVIREHTDNAMWLGPQQALNIEVLERVVARRGANG